MGRPELGTKLACTGCSERFYDLNRSIAKCPKCGAEQPLPKPRVYSKPGQSWRPRRQLVPVAAEADESSAAPSSEVDDAEEAGEDDTDSEVASEPDEDAEAGEPASLEHST